MTLNNTPPHLDKYLHQDSRLGNCFLLPVSQLQCAGHQYLGSTVLPGEVLEWNFPELPGFSSAGLS